MTTISQNSSVERDSNVNTQTSTVNTKVPLYPAPLPPRAFSEQGSIAFDKTARLFAYFDGLVWVYLAGGAINNIVNIGGGAQVFESFNPDTPANRTARFRTVLGAGGITVTQQASTITVDDGGENITDIQNNGGGAEVFINFNPNLPGNKVAQLRTIESGSENVTVTQLADTIEVAVGELGNTFNATLNETYLTTGASTGWETLDLWTTDSVTDPQLGNAAPTAPGWGVSGIPGGIESVTVSTPGVYHVTAKLEYEGIIDPSTRYTHARILAQRGADLWSPASAVTYPAPSGSSGANIATLNALVNQPVGAATTTFSVQVYVQSGAGSQPGVLEAATVDELGIATGGSYFSVTLVQYS